VNLEIHEGLPGVKWFFVKASLGRREATQTATLGEKEFHTKVKLTNDRLGGVGILLWLLGVTLQCSLDPSAPWPAYVCSSPDTSSSIFRNPNSS